MSLTSGLNISAKNGRISLNCNNCSAYKASQTRSFHTEHNEEGEPPRVLITGKSRKFQIHYIGFTMIHITENYLTKLFNR